MRKAHAGEIKHELVSRRLGEGGSAMVEDGYGALRGNLFGSRVKVCNVEVPRRKASMLQVVLLVR